MTKPHAAARKAPFRDIMALTAGDGMNSLIMNSIFGFAMLYYTDALGLSPSLAGIAMFVATFWDAITDPVMGHITDNTRSRFGRRHPYMLLGAVLTVACYFFIWSVPDSFRAPSLLFWYLVVINLLLRTGLTIFVIAQCALGFEMCTDYAQRATLQGVRWGFNMAVNLAGPGLAWVLFFPDRADGVEGTAIADNYVHMGAVFSVAGLAFALICVFATRKYIVDTRQATELGGNNPGELLRDLKEIFLDRIPRTVFIFTAIVFIGLALGSSLQMYIYVHFMQFPSLQKSIVHGGSMVACGLGGLVSPLVVARLDKKPAVCIAVTISVVANMVLLGVFVPGLIQPGASYLLAEGVPFVGGYSVPVAMLIFLLFHGLFWFGVGITCPIAASMMADVSEICKYRTGKLKDGGYAAMMSFITKASMSVGLFLTGYCLDWTGFVEGGEEQSPAALKRLAAATFLSGAVFALVALAAIVRYPVTRSYMQDVKDALAKSEQDGVAER